MVTERKKIDKEGERQQKSPTEGEALISNGHLDTLGMIHECKCIAYLYSFQCAANEMKMPPRKGAMDRSFLLDTVRHISSYLEF
jgi:hypothetical protein